MKNERHDIVRRSRTCLYVTLFASLALSGCATQQYKIRIETEGRVPEPGALVVISEGAKLPALGVVYFLRGSIRGVFTGEDAGTWMQRAKNYPPVMVGVTDEYGTATIKMKRTDVIINAINADLTCVWSRWKPRKHWSRSVEHMLTSDDMEPCDNDWGKIILDSLDRSMGRKENQRPEIIEYKNRLEKFLEGQPLDDK